MDDREQAPLNGEGLGKPTGVNDEISAREGKRRNFGWNPSLTRREHRSWKSKQNATILMNDRHILKSLESRTGLPLLRYDPFRPHYQKGGLHKRVVPRKWTRGVPCLLQPKPAWYCAGV